MIIIKNVPGLGEPDVMAAVADRIPLGQIETGYGGIVVDERTALAFLQRYLAAVDGAPAETAETAETAEVPTPESTVKARGGRQKRKEEVQA